MDEQLHETGAAEVLLGVLPTFTYAADWSSGRSPMSCALKMSVGERSRPRAFITLKMRCALSRSGVLTTTSQVCVLNRCTNARRSPSSQSESCSQKRRAFAWIAFWASVFRLSGFSSSRPPIAPGTCTWVAKNCRSFGRRASRGSGLRPWLRLPRSRMKSLSSVCSSCTAVRSRRTAKRMVRVVSRCCPSMTSRRGHACLLHEDEDEEVRLVGGSRHRLDDIVQQLPGLVLFPRVRPLVVGDLEVVVAREHLVERYLGGLELLHRSPFCGLVRRWEATLRRRVLGGVAYGGVGA
ncbi:MAG: hypothetical protein R2694_16085 [Ilumatobacteraceae bacterium]